MIGNGLIGDWEEGLADCDHHLRVDWETKPFPTKPPTRVPAQKIIDFKASRDIGEKRFRKLFLNKHKHFYR